MLRFHEWSFYPYNNPVRSVDPTLQIRKQKDAISCTACRWQNCDTHTHLSVDSGLHLVLVSQSCPTVYDLKDCSPRGSSVHGILQTRILEGVAMPSFRGSSQHRDRTQVSHIAGGFFTIWAPREAPLFLKSIQRWGQKKIWLIKSQHLIKFFTMDQDQWSFLESVQDLMI